MSLPLACQRVQGRLLQRADGGLPVLEAALDAGHLEACAECARREAEHAGLLDALRRACRLEAGPAGELDSLHAQVLARLPARQAPEVHGSLRPRASRSLGRRALAPAAAAVLAVLWTQAGLPSLPPLPRPAALEGWVDGLPTWSELLRGLERLADPDG